METLPRIQCNELLRQVFKSSCHCCKDTSIFFIKKSNTRQIGKAWRWALSSSVFFLFVMNWKIQFFPFLRTFETKKKSFFSAFLLPLSHTVLGGRTCSSESVAVTKAVPTCVYAVHSFFFSCIFSKRPCWHAPRSFSHTHFFQSERRKRSENLPAVLVVTTGTPHFSKADEGRALFVCGGSLFFGGGCLDKKNA